MRDEESCRNFLDQWDAVAFADPIAGRRHADQGLRWVAKLKNPPALHARALTILGSSYRAVEDPPRTEEAFQKALAIYRAMTYELRSIALDQADLYRRLAYLRLEQRRYAEALDLVDQAVPVFVSAGCRHELGRVYLAKGVIQLKMGDRAAISTLCHALSTLDTERSPSDYHAATHNLLFALCNFEPDGETLDRAFKFLQVARLSSRSRSPGRRRSHQYKLLGHRRPTMPDAKTRFLQGRILLLLGDDAAARRALESARADLIALDMPLAVAEVSIELAECYLMASIPSWGKIQRLAQEALQLLAAVPNAGEILVACELLHKAAVARSLTQARRELAAYRKRLGLNSKLKE